MWTAIRHAAHGGADVRALALDRVPRAAWREGSVCLDLGCSIGGMTRALLARADDVEGLDASPAMLSVARLLHPSARFSLADVCLDDLGEDDVAVATLAFVLHEMPAEAQRLALRNALRALRGRGCLCVVDIDPRIVRVNATVRTGPEPYLREYVAGVEAAIAESARRHGRRVIDAADLGGARVWIVR